MSMVRAGAWVTLLMCVVGGIYTAAFADPSNRLGLTVMIATAGAGGAAVLFLVPWKRVVASSWREWAFLSWTASTVAVIAATAAADGGAESPLALMLFLPVIFASLAYPLRFVVASALLAQTALLLLVLLDAGDSLEPGAVLAFCGAIAGAAFMAVWQASNHDTWRQELTRSSLTDPLTAILNRRGFALAADAAFSALDRRGSPVTLLLIDLDRFKSYNDAHGHHAGDALLCWVGAQLTSAVRPSDSVARLGGDEFAVLLPETDPEAARDVIARLCRVLTSRTAHCLGRASAPEQGSTFDELYRVADADLYRSKVERAPAAENGDPAALARQRRQRRSVSAEAILAGITEAFYVLDEQWRFVYVNESAERLLDRKAEQLIGRAVWDEFPDARDTVFEDVFQRVADRGIAESFTEHYGPLGTTFSVRASAVPGGISVYFHDAAQPLGAPRP